MAKAKPRVGDRINLPETAASPLPDGFFGATQANGNGSTQQATQKKPARQSSSQPVLPAASPSSRPRSSRQNPSQLPDSSQASDFPKRRKATFRLSYTVLEQLAALQTQLQQEFSKAEIPSKEIMVEEAIAQFLAKSTKNHRSLLAKLKERQRQR